MNSHPASFRGIHPRQGVGRVRDRHRGRRAVTHGLDFEPLEGRQLMAAPVDIAEGLSHSAEYYQRVVVEDYQKYLARTPSSGEVASVSGLLESGLTDEALATDLVASPEYLALHGSDDASWVDAAYQDILGRPASALDLQNCLAALANGATHVELADGLATGLEHDIDLVSANYQSILGRPAPADGLAYWSAQLQAGMSDEDVLARFVGSAEFYKDMDSFDFVWLDVAYGEILSRTPDVAGLSNGLLALEGSATNVLKNLDVLDVALAEAEATQLVADGLKAEASGPTGFSALMTGALQGISTDLNSNSSPDRLFADVDTFDSYAVSEYGYDPVAAVLDDPSVQKDVTNLVQLRKIYNTIGQNLQAAQQPPTTAPTNPFPSSPPHDINVYAQEGEIDSRQTWSDAVEGFFSPYNDLS